MNKEQQEKHYVEICTHILSVLPGPWQEHVVSIEKAGVSSKLKILRAVGRVWPETGVASIAPFLEEYPTIPDGLAARLILGLPGAALVFGLFELWTVLGCLGGIFPHAGPSARNI